VGIGTTITSNASISIMNGNVGIGTWVPATNWFVNGTTDVTYTGADTPGPGGSALYINASGSTLNNGPAFKLDLPTTGAQKAFQFVNGADALAWASFEYNVGGAGLPGLALGPGGNTARDTNIYRYAAGVFRTNTAFITDGNVGIGTTLTTLSALTVINGNVGIGTWVPAFSLDLVNNTARGRIVRRVNTVASSATPAINTDTTDLFTITALAANITSFTTNLTGTPNNGDLLEIRILDNGTARTITWGDSFSSTTTTLPATTVISTTLRVLLEWNSASSVWECIGVT